MVHDHVHVVGSSVLGLLAGSVNIDGVVTSSP